MFSGEGKQSSYAVRGKIHQTLGLLEKSNRRTMFLFLLINWVHNLVSVF